MSSGLMSCVRENSPPLEMSESNDSGPMSLPTTTTTSSPTNTPTADTQKRRRFHPLRNLRRIFKRRTLTNCDSATSTITTTRSEILTPIQIDSQTSESMYALTQSSPSSPLQHQLVKTSDGYLNNSKILHDFPICYSSSTPLVKAPSYTKMSNHYSSSKISSTITTTMSASSITTATTTTTTAPFGLKEVIAGMATAVQKSSISRGVVHNSANTSSSSGHYYSNKESHITTGATELIMEENREMTDHQRSLSEGRLMDSDFNRDALSQSHDSVFSEAPTASSYSIVLKAELADVLRKRRNPRDTSEEDLGLPRSPTTPQRHDNTANNNSTIPSEVSSLSLLSMVSSDLDDDFFSHYQPKFDETDRTGSSLASSRKSPNTSKNSDDIDFNLLTTTRLSHSAAKHKMAIRPKKKGPTRYNRVNSTRTQEIKVLPATPELNEDVVKMNTLDVKDNVSNKTKSRSLPPGVNAKILEQHSEESKPSAVSIKRSKTKVESSSSSYCSNVSNNENFQTQKKQPQNKTTLNSTTEKAKEDENGFFHRLWLRNSKRKNKVDECDKADTNTSNNTSILQKTNCEINQKKFKTITVDKTNDDYSKLVEEKRKEIRREIEAESKSELSVILNSFMMSGESDVTKELSVNKPKSGPAARQRYVPKDLSTQTPPPTNSIDDNLTPLDVNENAAQTKIQNNSENSENLPQTFRNINSIDGKITINDSSIDELIVTRKIKQISSSKDEECFYSTTLIREISLAQKMRDKEQLYEKRHQTKIVGLSPFQQKISRSNDAFNIATLTISDEISSPQKQRKAVEKSKSFRTYTDNSENLNLLKSNVPSLPDLSQTDNHHIDDLSLGFEINDNNLVKNSSKDNLPLSHGIYTKNIILTTSKSNIPKINSKHSIIATTPVSPKTGIKNISQIEENIDQLVKSPFISVLRKSTSSIDTFGNKLPPNVSISPMTTKKVDLYENNDAKKSSRTLIDIKTSTSNSTSISTSQKPPPISTKPPLILTEAPKTPESILKSITPTIETNILNTSTKSKTDTKLAYSSLISKTNINEKSTRQSTETVSSELEKMKTIPNNSNTIVGKTTRTSLENIQNVDKSKVIITNDLTKQIIDNSVMKASAGSNSISANLIKPNVIATRDLTRQSTENLAYKSLPAADCSPLTKIDITKVQMREKSINSTKDIQSMAERKSDLSDSENRISTQSSQSSRVSSTNGANKSRRNSAVIDNSSSKSILPEFMKIQLNRVDSSRPKSTVVLSKNTRENSCEDLTRRYSNESVEIADTKNSQPATPTSTSPELKTENKRFSGLQAKVEDSCVTTAGKSPTKKTEENSIFQNGEINKMSLSERRKFFTEEKSKVESKIERKKSICEDTRKKSICEDTRKKSICEDTRKISLDDDSSVVVMRRKSIVYKDDTTPELMKVFARRSLKVKDEDLPLPQLENNGQPQSKHATNLDSDKENQSSSEEKLNKIPSHNENTIQQQQQHQQVSQPTTDISNNLKNRSSITENRNKSISIVNNNNKNTLTCVGVTPTKSNIPPIYRQTNNNNAGYRNLSINYPRNNSLNVGNDQLSQSSEKNNNNNCNSNNNNHNINNNNDNKINSTIIMSSINGTNNNNSSLNANARHTIGPSNITTITSQTCNALTQSSSTTTLNDIQRNETQKMTENKFMGISQRKAEWEKRAQEASK